MCKQIIQRFRKRYIENNIPNTRLFDEIFYYQKPFVEKFEIFDLKFSLIEINRLRIIEINTKFEPRAQILKLDPNSNSENWTRCMPNFIGRKAMSISEFFAWLYRNSMNNENRESRINFLKIIDKIALKFVSNMRKTSIWSLLLSIVN